MEKERYLLKITVGISGASGANLGLNFVKKLPLNIEVFLVLSKSAKIALKLENGISVKKTFEEYPNVKIFLDSNIAAPIASGSFEVDKMIIIPCSMNTLAKCSVGISDSLITRAFTVMLKEKRDIILAPREMPLNSIALENMLKLSNLGVIIAPPVLGYYSSQQTLEEMENFLIGKWFDLLKIDNNLYERWK
jgi:4-hydroxy-3-polyprenylbenzoate decarboxylase